jgi:hypothetical protein
METLPVPKWSVAFHDYALQHMRIVSSPSCSIFNAVCTDISGVLVGAVVALLTHTILQHSSQNTAYRPNSVAFHDYALQLMCIMSRPSCSILNAVCSDISCVVVMSQQWALSWPMQSCFTIGDKMQFRNANSFAFHHHALQLLFITSSPSSGMENEHIQSTQAVVEVVWLVTPFGSALEK